MRRGRRRDIPGERSSGDFEGDYGLNGFFMQVVFGQVICDGRSISSYS